MKTVVVATWLAAELLKLPGSHAPDETREEYAIRAKEIASALAEEATPYANGTGWTSTEISAAGAVIVYSETLLDKRIQVGESHPVWTQDHGLAKCGFQLHASGIVPQDVWERLAGPGTDAIHLCAQYGLRVVVAQAKQCGVFIGVRADRTRVAKMFASFASGGKCVPEDRDWKRADLWLKMMAARPDHEKKTFPGYRRAAPAEIPKEILSSARGILSEIGKEPEMVPGFKRTEYSHDGRTFMSVIEKHAEGKVGVSVLVAETVVQK